MAATKYVYSIVNDTASGKLDSNALTFEIEQSNIVTALERIDISGDVLDIWFKDSLSSNDETTLDNLVSTHTGIALPAQASPVEVVQSNKFRLLEFNELQDLPKGTAQIETVVCSANTSSSLNNGLFLWHTPGNGKHNYCLHFNCNGAGSAPEILGYINAEVELTADDTADEVATALKNTIDDLDDATAAVNSNTVTITNDLTGPAAAITDGTDTSATNFTFEVTTTGGGFTTVYSYIGQGSLWSVWFDVTATKIDLEITLDNNEVIVPQINLDIVTGFGASGQASMMSLVHLGNSNFAFTPREKITFNSKIEIKLKSNDDAVGIKKLNQGYISLIRVS